MKLSSFFYVTPINFCLLDKSQRICGGLFLSKKVLIDLSDPLIEGLKCIGSKRYKESLHLQYASFSVIPLLITAILLGMLII